MSKSGGSRTPGTGSQCLKDASTPGVPRGGSDQGPPRLVGGRVSAPDPGLARGLSPGEVGRVRPSPDPLPAFRQPRRSAGPHDGEKDSNINAAMPQCPCSVRKRIKGESRRCGGRRAEWVGYGEKSAERLAQRNGYRDRTRETRAGTVELRIPKLRRRSTGASCRPQSGQATLRSTTCPAYGIWAPIRGPRIDQFKQSLAPPGKARRTRLSKKT